MSTGAQTNTPTTPAPAAANRRKGPRPKHVPQRMCIACRLHDAKRGLVRIVRTPEGPIEIDLHGKRNGRGAYLCHQSACWERALGSGMLARALKTDISEETAAELRQFATRMAQADAADANNEGSCA